MRNLTCNAASVPLLRQGIALVDEVGRQAYHMLAPYLLPTIDRGLQTVDGFSKQYLGYHTNLYQNSRNIWA